MRDREVIVKEASVGNGVSRELRILEVLLDIRELLEDIELRTD